MTESATNPYQAPTEAAGSTAIPVTEPISFGGSMTLEEGWQIDELLTGRQRGGTVSPGPVWGLAGAALLLTGILGWDALVYGEADMLLEMLAGVGLVGVALCVAVLHRARRTATHARLKDERSGAFSDIAGRVRSDGIDFLSGDLPVRYQWDDFVGAKLGRDAAVLYVSYPRELNYLAASMFSDPSGWEQAREAIRESVPLIGRFPRLSLREASPRMSFVTAGARALDESDWPAALAAFDNALAIAPDDAQALQGRLIAALGLQDIPLASEAAEQAASHGLQDCVTRRLRATVLLQCDDYAGAFTELNWLLQQAPEDADLLRDRGLAHFKLGRYDDAARDAAEAIRRNPEDFVALNNHGAALLEIGRRDDAIRSLHAAIALAPPEFERPRELLALAKV